MKSYIGDIATSDRRPKMSTSAERKLVRMVRNNPGPRPAVSYLPYPPASHLNTRTNARHKTHGKSYPLYKEVDVNASCATVWQISQICFHLNSDLEIVQYLKELKSQNIARLHIWFRSLKICIYFQLLNNITKYQCRLKSIWSC